MSLRIISSFSIVSLFSRCCYLEDDEWDDVLQVDTLSKDELNAFFSKYAYDFENYCYSTAQKKPFWMRLVISALLVLM